MDTLVSLAYTIIDSICICLFLDAFASHRWKGYRFFIGVILQTILMFSFVEFSVIILNRNQIAKVLLIIPCSMRMDGFNSLLTYLSLRFRDKKSPFRYIIVEISNQNVYSFIQENLPDEDYSNAQLFNAVDAKMSVDGVD